MAKYKSGEIEVEALTFDEFKANIGGYLQQTEPRSNGANSYSLNLGDGRTYFGQGDMLVIMPTGKMIVYPPVDFENDFTKID